MSFSEFVGVVVVEEEEVVGSDAERARGMVLISRSWESGRLGLVDRGNGGSFEGGEVEEHADVGAVGKGEEADGVADEGGGEDEV